MREAISPKPNVVVVVPAITHEGISKQALLQVEALLKRGYNVKVIVLTTADTAMITTVAPGLASENVIELRQPDPYLSVRSLRSSALAALQIGRILKGQFPAVVLAHAPYAHFLMRMVMPFNLGSSESIKLWQYFHITQYAQYPVNTWKRRLINTFNKWLARKFDYGHVFVSEAVKQDIHMGLIKLSNNRVIYNALPESGIGKCCEGKSIKGADTGLFTMLLPGRLEAAKGQVWFLEPLKKFIELEQLRPEQVQVLVAGEGSQLGKLRQAIQGNGLQPYVKLLGNVPNSELVNHMRQSHVVVIPSFVEGLPLVILEALQQRATILASDILPNREVISGHDIGLTFKAGDVEDCVAKLQFIYQHKNKVLVNQTAIEAHLKTKFSFENHMQSLVSIIQSA